MTNDEKAEMVAASQIRFACVKLAEAQEHARRGRYEIEGRRSN